MARLKQASVPNIRRHQNLAKPSSACQGRTSTWGRTAVRRQSTSTTSKLPNGSPVAGVRWPQPRPNPRASRWWSCSLPTSVSPPATIANTAASPTEVKTIVAAANVVKGMYGREPAADFGPLKLQAVQQAMIRFGWGRKHINKQVGRIVRIFSWGVSQELVRATWRRRSARSQDAGAKLYRFVHGRCGFPP
jgi:hypothetical protein